MKKLCSLGFLNQKFFKTDILNKKGKVLHNVGEQITPSIILRLYFKDIFTNKALDPIKSKKKELTEKAEVLTSDTDSLLAKQLSQNLLEDEERQSANKQKIANETETSLNESQEYSREFNIEKEEPIYLKFDEEEAKNVVEYSKIIGESLHLSEKENKELEVAAYYHNIGRIKLKESDVNKSDFKKLQAEAGYMILEEKNMSSRIKEAARFYNSKYDPTAFHLDKNNPQAIPFSHIVSIANFYYNLERSGIAKDQILNKLMQLGGNRFNIFILHKFLNVMREAR